jgi:methionine-rich copper-binding protein CopC
MKRVLNSAIAVAIAFATLSLNPLAASAHDEVAGTNPAAGSTVQAGVIDVSVTFGEDIMKTPNNAGLAIEVLGPDGSESAAWSNGCVAVDGVKESTTVDLGKAGLYTVNWRSISGDGHENEGTFEFTVENKTGYESGGLVEPSADCVAQPVLYSEAEPSMTPFPKATEDPFISNLPYLGFGIGLIVLLSVTSVLVVDRRNKRNAEIAAKKKAKER